MYFLRANGFRCPQKPSRVSIFSGSLPVAVVVVVVVVWVLWRFWLEFWSTDCEAGAWDAGAAGCCGSYD